jgi:hypothetical protein
LRPDGISHLIPYSYQQTSSIHRESHRVYPSYTPIGEALQTLKLALRKLQILQPHALSVRVSYLTHPASTDAVRKSSVVLVSNQSPHLISALRHEPIRRNHAVEEAAARRRSPHPASALLGCVGAVCFIVVAVNERAVIAVFRYKWEFLRRTDC